MKRAVIALIATGLIGATLSPPAAGQDEGSRQTATLKFTTKHPGKPSGLVFQVDYVNPGDPAAKPPAVRQVAEKLAPGPRRRYWVNLVRFTYFDGVTQTVETRSPCKRKKRR